MIKKEKDGTEQNEKEGIGFPSLPQKSKKQAECYFFYNKAYDKYILSAPAPRLSDSERKEKRDDIWNKQKWRYSKTYKKQIFVIVPGFVFWMTLWDLHTLYMIWFEMRFSE